MRNRKSKVDIFFIVILHGRSVLPKISSAFLHKKLIVALTVESQNPDSEAEPEDYPEDDEPSADIRLQ
jgi:hypothetical protein